MRTWLLLLGGLLVWAAHFFLLYAIASVFPGTSTARILTLVVTAPALGANAALIWIAANRLFDRQDPLGQWIAAFAATAAGLSFVAVVWQALPALLV